MSGRASAHDVAALLIDKQLAAGRSIDKLQLQKLLYLVQGSNLVFWGEPAFREPIHAYRKGPVVRVVEETYREATDAWNIDRPLGGRPDRLSTEVIETVEEVVRRFGTWSGPALEAFTKDSGSPWVMVRGNLAADEPSTQLEIPVTAMDEWFHGRGLPSASPTTRWDASPDERQAATQELDAAQRRGAFTSAISDDERRAAERAIARSASER